MLRTIIAADITSKPSCDTIYRQAISHITNKLQMRYLDPECQKLIYYFTKYYRRTGAI
ncbi:hypothetical protein D3C77_463790 [compost metagenome]